MDAAERDRARRGAGTGVDGALAQGPPTTGSRSGVIDEMEITSIQLASPNVIQERVLEATVTDGPLQGTFVETTRGVIRPDGRVTFQGSMVFEGTLDGCGEGTLTARFAGQATAGALDADSPTPVLADASFRVVEQANNTIPVTAHGTLSQIGDTFTYEVSYVCHAHRGGGDRGPR